MIGKYFSLPTWLLYLTFKDGLKEDHAWYGKDYSLYLWDRFATTENRWMSFSMWVVFACLILLTVGLFKWN